MVVIQENHAKIVRKLLERLVDDFARGISPLEAGWISFDGSEADSLIELELTEKNHRGIRFRLDKVMEIQLEKRDKDVEELVNVCKDITKAVKVEQLIAQIVGELSNSAELQASIFFLGWWRMLETSEFPVSVDEILRANLSTDRWYIEAPKASFELALSVTRKWWNIDIEKTVKLLNAFHLTLPKTQRTKAIEQIRIVLMWEKALKLFLEKESKALAFLWFGDYLSVLEGICCEEALASIQASIWGHLEKSKGETRLEIVEQIEKMIGMLSSEQERLLKISWNEIIRLPW